MKVSNRTKNHPLTCRSTGTPQVSLAAACKLNVMYKINKQCAILNALQKVKNPYQKIIMGAYSQ